MGFKDDLYEELDNIFKYNWDVRDGRTVPADDGVKLGNDGVRIEAAVLYADMADSTEMVDIKKDTLSAEVYKAFLRAACKCITHNGGTITSFDGDRVMGVFTGNKKNTNAVKTGLMINWVVREIVNPTFKKTYTTSTFTIRHGVGIDNSNLLVAKTGIRGSNDLVWVGPSANYAAKLAAKRISGYPTLITKSVYDLMNSEAKYSGDKNMWTETSISGFKEKIFGSNFWWSV